ncbi:MAG: carbohydrate porin [Myxococcaceae bacterium]
MVEAYYTALLFRGVTVAGDVQGILNPGYNRDRGPILVTSVRVHLEL